MTPDSAAATDANADPRAPVPESYFWPLVALVVVILPQVFVPSSMRLGPPSFVPIVEGLVLLLLVAIAAMRGPVPRRARPPVLVLVSVLVVANTLAAGRLVVLVLRGSAQTGEELTANRLLVSAGIVLATNVVTFGLLFWQVDGGGPGGRQSEPRPYPDLDFPQLSSEGLAPPGWQPRFPDHLYVALTNVVAFSPTDTLPLTVRLKALMALQSLISLGVLVVVLARVINALPS